MALKSDFYSEIFEKEQKWIELINLKFLNSVYCKLTLKPFYMAKKNELEQEYNLTGNKIIEQVIPILGEIINKINLLEEAYNNGEDVDINSLMPLFLSVQMNNVLPKKENNLITQSDKLEIRKQVLENQVMSYDRNSLNIEDYVYDDFPEEVKRAK